MIERKHVAFLCLLAMLSLPAWASEETEYFAVFMQGKKVGHAVETRRVEGGKVVTSEATSITVSRIGMPLTIKMNERNVETIGGKPLAFDSVQVLSFVKTKVSGVVRDGGTLELTTSSLGMKQTRTMDWPKGAVMAEGLRLLELEKGLEEGTVYTAKVFFGGLMETVDVQVSVGAKTEIDLLGRLVKLTEVTTISSMPMSGPVTSVAYVDDQMRVLKDVTVIAGIQAETIACAKEFALGANDVVEFIGSMFLDSPAPLGDPQAASAITYWLVPHPEKDLFVPTTDNQRAERLANGTVKLVVNPVSAPAGAAFPYEGSDPELLEALEATRFLQSDNEAIVKLARQAIGDAKDAAEAARRIEAFVGDYIEDRSLSVGYASAVEVLESRQGDCSEFAVLTATLCRAVGIPARVVVGVAYVQEFAGHEGFGGHAWTQAYVGGKWIGLDAAFKGGGRGGYDAGHIALAVGNGEPADFFNMASALGSFTIEKLEVE